MLIDFATGPAHVGEGDTDYPTLMGYPTLGAALDAQRGFVERTMERLSTEGYAAAFYVGADEEDGDLTFAGVLRLVRDPREPLAPNLKWEPAEVAG